MANYVRMAAGRTGDRPSVCDGSVTGCVPSGAWCEGPGFPGRRWAPTVAGMAPNPRSEEPQDNPDNYVGLDSARAERLAEERGWSAVRSLPPGAIITMEYRAGRLNFEVTGGTVTRCWKG